MSFWQLSQAVIWQSGEWVCLQCIVYTVTSEFPVQNNRLVVTREKPQLVRWSGLSRPKRGSWQSCVQHGSREFEVVGVEKIWRRKPCQPQGLSFCLSLSSLATLLLHLNRLQASRQAANLMTIFIAPSHCACAHCMLADNRDYFIPDIFTVVLLGSWPVR